MSLDEVKFFQRFFLTPDLETSISVFVFIDEPFFNEMFCSPVAQSAEQVAVNHWVRGSSPCWGATTYSKEFKKVQKPLTIYVVRGFLRPHPPLKSLDILYDLMKN